MKAIHRFHHLDNDLQEQLEILEPILKKNSKVLQIYDNLISEDSETHNHQSAFTKKERKIIKEYAIYLAFNTQYFFHARWLEYLFCYDNRGNRVYLDKIITKSRDFENGRGVCLFMGHQKEIPVVVKWYLHSAKRDVGYEIDRYKELRHKKCLLPWFSSKYHLFKDRVLVMEKLDLLTKEDDEYKMGIDVLGELYYVHQFGVHCDIKPGNIMRTTRNDGHQKVRVYYLIDYGGMTVERKKSGFRRFVWSPKWTSQEPHESNQICYPKHDFIELGFTMRAIQVWRSYDCDNSVTGPKIQGEKELVKQGFQGRLRKYFDRLDEMGHEIHRQDYVDLIDILRGQDND